MFCMLKKKKIYPVYVSKHDSKREKQAILLRFQTEKWHYIAVKKPSALLRGITSKNSGDCYCLNCLHSFRTKNKLDLHKKVCENKGFCDVVMPPEENKILEFNQY